MEGLCENVIPALCLVFSSDSFQTVHHMDSGREFRHLGQRQESYYMDNWLRQLNCEEVGFLCSIGIWR